MPRKYPRCRSGTSAALGRFNEAGADAPEIPRLLPRHCPDEAVASMRPGRMPRKYRGNPGLSGQGHQASMRPGRMPRKYRGNGRRPRSRSLFRFNEAGADAPEIPAPLSAWCRTPACFNEAGADAPEIPKLPAGQLVAVVQASMRPGRMPRKYRCGRERGAAHPAASMRPGRMPRKYRLAPIRPKPRWRRLQ